MKRFLFLALLAALVGGGVFVAWMNSGGGAAVELSEEEKAAALESGAGAQKIAVDLSDEQLAAAMGREVATPADDAEAAGEDSADEAESTVEEDGAAEAVDEPLLPSLEDLKLVTDRAQLDRWASRTSAAREASSGDQRLLLTVLMAEIERLRGNVVEARALATEGAEGLPTNSRARQVNAASILSEIVKEAGDGGMGAVVKNLPKVKTYKAELRAAIELDPSNADARVAEIIVLAFAPWPVGNKKKAKGLIEELGPYDEFRRDFWRAMLVSADKKRQEEALEAFRELESQNPTDPDVLFTIGDLLGKLDRWKEAAEVFDSIITEPMTRQGYNALYQAAKAREKIEFELEKALAMLERFEEENPLGELMPSMDRVVYHRGRVLEKMGRLMDARAAYVAAEEIKPGEKRVAEGLARVDAALAGSEGDAAAGGDEG